MKNSLDLKGCWQKQDNHGSFQCRRTFPFVFRNLLWDAAAGTESSRGSYNLTALKRGKIVGQGGSGKGHLGKDQSIPLKEFSLIMGPTGSSSEMGTESCSLSSKWGLGLEPTHPQRVRGMNSRIQRGNSEKTLLGRYHFSPGSCTMSVWPNFTCGFSHRKQLVRDFYFLLSEYFVLFLLFKSYSAPLLLYF